MIISVFQKRFLHDFLSCLFGSGKYRDGANWAILHTSTKRLLLTKMNMELGVKNCIFESLSTIYNLFGCHRLSALFDNKLY